MFSTTEATEKLTLLFDQWKTAKEQGVEQDFSFQITFAREAQLQGKKLKQAIDDHYNSIPGTTKRTKSKSANDDGVELNIDLDDGSKRFEIGFKFHKLFVGVAHIGIVDGYDPRDRMYHVTYQDGDEESLFHNKIHAHKDKIVGVPYWKKPETTATSEPFKARKKKDICRKYRTRSWRCKSKQANIAATNRVLNLLYLAKLAPTPIDYDEHEHVSNINDIRAIASLRQTWKEKEEIDMSEDAIPTEMIKLIINTLGSDAITPEEQQLGYFTRNKLQKLNTWDQWLAGEKKQIDHFMNQGMFGSPMSRSELPKDAVILRPHWKYLAKRSGVRRSRICCNDSKKSAPQLHAVASTWLSCVLLPIQRLFLGMCADLGLIIYGGDCTDAYAHSPAPNFTYLSIDKTYADWYKNKFKKRIDRRMVLPVYYALQGHPESGKQWMHMIIDEKLIKKMGFQTTTHDRCIYCRVTSDGKMQLLLRQVDNFLLACNSEQVAKDKFDDIGIAIQFDAEKRDGVISFEFLGVVKDYNGVDIKQTKDYIEISCANYIRRLLKSHGWDKNSLKPLPSEMILVPVSNSDSTTVDASNGIVTENVSCDNAVVTNKTHLQIFLPVPKLEPPLKIISQIKN